MNKSLTRKKVTFVLVIAILWLVEGTFIFIDVTLKGKWYTLWSAVFCGTHPMLLDKSVESMDTKKNTILFILILSLNVLASGISMFFFIRNGKLYCIIFSTLKFFILWLFYRFLKKNRRC